MSSSIAGSQVRAELGAAVEQPSDRLRLLVQRWPAVVGATVTAPFIVLAVVALLQWPGRPFPGFLVMGNGVVPSVGLWSWTGIRDGVPFHAQVVAVDGRPVRTNADVYARAEAVPVGTPLAYTLRRDGEVFVRRVPTMRFGLRDLWLTIGLLVVFGIVSATTGIAVATLQPRSSAAMAFLVQGVLTGIFALTGSMLYQPALWAMIHPHLVAQAAFPAAFVHLGLVFPVPRRAVQRRPAWLAVPYAIAAVLVVWVMRGFQADPPDMLALHATYVWSAGSIVALVGLTAYSWIENRTRRVRPQLYAVLPGLVIGTGVGLYGFLDTARGGGRFPINLIAVTPFVFYLSIGWAIARHGLFDVGRVAKQAIVYATLTAAISGAHAVAVAVVSGLGSSPVGSTSFTVLFVVVVAAAFEPARRAVQTTVDRMFWRSSPDYRRTVLELSAALTTLLDPDDVLARVGRTVTEGFQLRSFAVVLWSGGSARLRRWNVETRAMADVATPDVSALHTRLVARPNEPWAPDAASAADGLDVHAAREAHAQGAALVIPLAVGGRLVGAFLIGRRRSARPLRRAELELLSTLAAQTAIALSNAQAYRALEAVNAELEQKVRTRTAALEDSHAALSHTLEVLKSAQTQLVHSEKMASLGVLVAGVAHEINNPVSFILGSVDPLRAAMAEIRTRVATHPDTSLGTLVDDARRAVELIGRGADRTAGIVKDLQRFSRRDASRRIVVDVHEGIETSLQILRPTWQGRIAIHRDYGAVPPIEAAPDELNQVWMNLLANACDAVGAAGNVWIRTAASAETIAVTIADDGAGIPLAAQARIFDPFFTTKPPGKGTGLGLAVSHGIISGHGGRIAFTSQPGRGAEFTVVLPRAQRTTHP